MSNVHTKETFQNQTHFYKKYNPKIRILKSQGLTGNSRKIIFTDRICLMKLWDKNLEIWEK